jgi:hypothetical protein
MMAKSINDRINQLRSRRDGSAGVTLDSASTFAKSLYPSLESWEKRASSSQPHTRYAIGAMQPVSDAYTKVSLETANRVISQLRDRMPKAGIEVQYRLQGSVPLDVHIKGVSDVDLLVLDTDFLVYKTAGAKAMRGGYTNPSTKTSVGVLSRLRTQIESDLETAFPAAKVDKTGAKAVKVSGGSLARHVDVVPSHWLDTIEYQASGIEVDRGVTILDNKAMVTVENLPFLHIERIRARCVGIGGGLRKSIRLCKNVKEDSDQKIMLPSFDIAATMYHADMTALRRGLIYDLAILGETQRHLDNLARNPSYAKGLLVPDLSRPIFNTDEKWQGLLQLSAEMDDLLSNVYAENAAGILSYGRPMSEKRNAISAVAA